MKYALLIYSAPATSQPPDPEVREAWIEYDPWPARNSSPVVTGAC